MCTMPHGRCRPLPPATALPLAPWLRAFDRLSARPCPERRRARPRRCRGARDGGILGPGRTGGGAARRRPGRAHAPAEVDSRLLAAAPLRAAPPAVRRLD